MSHYVMTDIHGHYDRFKKALKSTNNLEHLYILGDVIDRGPKGILILLECIRNAHITLLMGNHEWMMLQVLNEISSKNYEFENHDSENYRRWQKNGCETTINEFNQLMHETKVLIHQYLKSLPIVIGDVKVRKYSFYLVHGFPYDTSIIGAKYAFDFNDSKEVDHFIWKRVMNSTETNNNQIVLFGHTMTNFYQNIEPYSIWTDGHLFALDCGLAADNNHSRLALFNLDLLSVRYY